MFLLGAGHFHPETVIDNSFLTELDIGTSDEWIMDRVGIQTRRTVLPLSYIFETRNQDPSKAAAFAQHSATDMAVRAAQMAMKRAQVKPSDITLCIAASSVPQMCIPPLGCLVASQLEIQAPAFDLNSACSSLVAQLHFTKQIHSSGCILIVQSETYTMATNYNDRNTAVLWGDGASAWVLSHNREGPAKIVQTTFDSNPSEAKSIVIPYAGHFSQQGSRVQKFAITQTINTFNALTKPTQNVHFIGHQANLRMLETAVKKMGPLASHHFNVDRYGNCGAAGAPSVLSENWESYRLGDTIVLVTVGAGLSWGGIVIQYL